MNKKSNLTIWEEAIKQYDELYPQFNFFWNKTLIAIGLISIILIILNSAEIINIGTRTYIIVSILILSAWKVLFRLWEYKGFVEGYEMWHKKGFDTGREKWIK